MENKFEPETQKIRTEAAAEIIEQRRIDRIRGVDYASDYSRTRGLLEYTNNLQGLTNYLAYIRSLPFRKGLLLDIGSGSTKAMAELSTAEDLSYNLAIKATSLAIDKDARQNLGREKIVITNAESLRGIKDAEVSGAISVFSIGHSAAPELVAKSIDRVLVPSGAFKSVFSENPENIDNGKWSERHKRLIKSFRDMGYSLALSDIEGVNFSNEPLITTVMLAIKKPVVGISAHKLLDLDRETYKTQISELISRGHKPITEALEEKHGSIEERKNTIRLERELQALLDDDEF